MVRGTRVGERVRAPVCVYDRITRTLLYTLALLLKRECDKRVHSDAYDCVILVCSVSFALADRLDGLAGRCPPGCGRSGLAPRYMR